MDFPLARYFQAFVNLLSSPYLALESRLTRNRVVVLGSAWLASLV